MKRILFLLGMAGALFIGPAAEESYSMSGKRKLETTSPAETGEAGEMGLDRLKEKSGEGTEATGEPKEYIVEALKQPEIIVNEQNIGGLYKELSDKVEKPGFRRYPAEYSGDYFEVYTGEILEVISPDVKTVRIKEAPYMSEYDTLIKEGLVFFETYYQGEYTIQVEDSRGNIREIAIRARHKYSFTEKQNYDIILNSYNARNMAVFEPAMGLFELSFPDSFRIKETFIMEARLNIHNKRMEEGRRNLAKIRGNFILTDSERRELIILEEQTYKKGSMAWEDHLYRNTDIGVLKDMLLGHIYSKKDITERDVVLLKEEYSSSYDKRAAKLLGYHFKKKGAVGEAVKYLSYAGEYEAISRIYLQEGDMDAFEESLSKVGEASRARLNQEKAKEDARARVKRELDLGKEKVEEENFQEGILFFERAKKRDNVIAGEMGVELELGKSYYNLENYEKAIEHLEMVSLTEQDTYSTLEAQYYVAMSYYRSEKFDESLNFFEKIVKDFPETSWAKKSMIYIMRLRKE